MNHLVKDIIENISHETIWFYKCLTCLFIKKQPVLDDLELVNQIETKLFLSGLKHVNISIRTEARNFLIIFSTYITQQVPQSPSFQNALKDQLAAFVVKYPQIKISVKRLFFEEKLRQPSEPQKEEEEVQEEKQQEEQQEEEQQQEGEAQEQQQEQEEGLSEEINSSSKKLILIKLKTFLDLPHPKVNSQIFDFLLNNGEYLIEFISRLSGEQIDHLLLKKEALTNTIFDQEIFATESIAIRRSYYAMTILTGVCGNGYYSKRLSKSLLTQHSRKIILHLFAAYKTDYNPKANLYHVNKVLLYICQNFPKTMLQVLNSQVGQYFSRYVSNLIYYT